MFNVHALIGVLLLSSSAYAMDIDDGDAGMTYSMITGGGWHRVFIPSANYSDSLRTFNNGAWAKYEFPVLPGTYDVYMRWPSWAGTLPDSAAPILIKHSTGSQTVAVNQQVNGGKWNLLGRWPMNSSSYVTVTNRGQGPVYADGVRLVSSPSVDPCVSTTTTTISTTTTTTSDITVSAPPKSPATCAEARATADVVFCQDFDRSALGDWNLSDLKSDFPGTSGYIAGPTGAPEGEGNGRTTIVSGGGDAVSGNSLRAKFSKNTLGSNSGALFRAPIGANLEEAYIGYWVRFESSFPDVKGGKLPGLEGGTTDAGQVSPCCGRPMKEGLGFSTRMMFVGGRRFVNYFYWIDNPTPVSSNGSTYGGPMGAMYTWIPGKWHFIEEHVKLNAPAGASNGLFEAWIDGKKVTTIANARIRGPGANFTIGHILFHTYLGGSDSSWYSPVDTYNYFDVVVVSRERIGWQIGS